MPISLSDVSPLRYPGSKAALVNYISELIKENNLAGCHFIEPYAGSAIVSLKLIENNIASKAIIVERDPLIYAFWQSVFDFSDMLVQKIYELPISIDTWHEFQKYRKTDNLNTYPLIEMGLAGFFFNRTNFSGILKANPLGGLKQESQYKINCRFNKSRLIEQIQKISQMRKRVKVVFGDALSYIKKSKSYYFKKHSCFLYVDPPYYEKGKDLYRYWYNHNDHKNLAQVLTKLSIPWIASYDNHKEIRNIYSKANAVETMYFDYTISRWRKEQELLISNLEIPPGVKALFKTELA